jgi:flagellar motor switch protein FliM
MDSKRAFTVIELAILERVTRQMLHFFDEAWAKVIKLKSHLERLETSSQFAQIIDLNEATAVVTINVKIGEDSGVISVCLPHMSVEPVAKQLNTRSWFSGTQNRKVLPKSDYMQRRLFNSPITVYAVFNDTAATVKDIANLQVGDVIQLEHKVGVPLPVKLQHIPKFYASIGTKGKRYAVKIEEIIREEE